MLHGDRCTCPAEIILTLHRKMPKDDNELRVRLNALQAYSLEIVGDPITFGRGDGSRRRLHLQSVDDAVIALSDAFFESGRIIVARRSAFQLFTAEHLQALRDAWARRKAVIG
jgi:hypothetical protein